MHIFFNTGVKTTNMVGDIPGVGRVWYHSEGIENILSMALIQKDYQVKYYSILYTIFRVCNKEKKKYRAFKKSKGDLYYTDMSNRGIVLTLATVT